MTSVKGIIQNFFSLLWQDFINLLHVFDRHSRDEKIRAYSKELRKEGILVMPNYLDSDACDDLRSQIEALAATHTSSVDFGNGTKINYRGEGNPDAADIGMVDFFHIERMVKGIDKVDTDLLVKVLESTCQQEIIPYRVNAYLNRGVRGTRGYHIDNAQPVVYKAFIYLVDVPEVGYGPYSFVKRSHRFSGFVYRNILANLFKKQKAVTDMPKFNKKQQHHYTAPKGTLIISNQNGIHRGMPQEADKKRVAVVFSFLVKSKLSYIHTATKQNLKDMQAIPA